MWEEFVLRRSLYTYQFWSLLSFKFRTFWLFLCFPQYLHFLLRFGIINVFTLMSSRLFFQLVNFLKLVADLLALISSILWESLLLCASAVAVGGVRWQDSRYKKQRSAKQSVESSLARQRTQGQEHSKACPEAGSGGLLKAQPVFIFLFPVLASVCSFYSLF